MVNRAKETYGFGSTKAPPRIKELKEFEKDLIRLMQGIRFRKRSNSFLGNLKKEIGKITNHKSLIVPADKTTNNYLVPPEKYRTLVDREIQKNYRKENVKNVGKVSLEHMHTAADLELDDRIFNTTPREAFVTLKDHKPDFQIRPSVRLINPTKHELGKVAMKILDDVVKQIRKKKKPETMYKHKRSHKLA